jgi:hypothetical protein
MVAETVTPPTTTTGVNVTNAIVEERSVIATDSTHSQTNNNVVSVPSTPEPSSTAIPQRRQVALEPPEVLSVGIPVDTDDEEVVVEQTPTIATPADDIAVATINNSIRTSTITSNQQQPILVLHPTTQLDPLHDNTSSTITADHRGRTVTARTSTNDSMRTELNNTTGIAGPASTTVTGSPTPAIVIPTANNPNNHTNHGRQQHPMSTIGPQLATTPRSIVTSSSIISSPSYTSNPNNIRCINPASGMYIYIICSIGEHSYVHL